MPGLGEQGFVPAQGLETPGQVLVGHGDNVQMILVAGDRGGVAVVFSAGATQGDDAPVEEILQPA